MSVFPVLYMVAENNCLKQRVFHSILIQCNIAKNGECSAPLWSFNFLSMLKGAANCVRFCLNPFCHEVHKSCLPHDKKDSNKTNSTNLYPPTKGYLREICMLFTRRFVHVKFRV